MARVFAHFDVCVDFSFVSFAQKFSYELFTIYSVTYEY